VADREAVLGGLHGHAPQRVLVGGRHEAGDDVLLRPLELERGAVELLGQRRGDAHVERVSVLHG
jgi:hypothetical protein